MTAMSWGPQVCVTVKSNLTAPILLAYGSAEQLLEADKHQLIIMIIK